MISFSEPNSLLKKGSDPLETSLGQEKIERSERGRSLFQQATNDSADLECEQALTSF